MTCDQPTLSTGSLLSEVSTEECSYPPLPSDDLLREQAVSVARGVQPLALVGSCNKPTVMFEGRCTLTGRYT